MEIPTNIDIVKDGEEAIRAIRRAMTFHSLPDSVLLDLNIPKRSGYVVLSFIRANEKPAKICVVIYTGSRDPDEMRRALENKANGYLAKPWNARQMEKTASKLQVFLAQAREDSCSFYEDEQGISGNIEDLAAGENRQRL